MLEQSLINDHSLIIQRVNHGIKLLYPDQVNPFKKQIAFEDMLNMPFHVYFLNRESAVEHANSAMLDAINISSVSDIFGLTAWDILKNKSAMQAIHHDSIVLNAKRLLIKDEWSEISDEIRMPVLSFKYPWYDETNQLIGVFGLSIALDNKHGMSLADSMRLLTQTGLLQSENEVASLPGLPCGDTYFTQCEKVILLQLIRGKTARSIAHMIDRSQRTVESHIENMKSKTGSSTKSELIEKIVDQLF